MSRSQRPGLTIVSAFNCLRRELHWRGDLAPFHEFLALGELLHLGKNATFGLGRYHLTTEIA